MHKPKGSHRVRWKRAGCIDSSNFGWAPWTIQAISRPFTPDRLLSLLQIRDHVRTCVDFDPLPKADWCASARVQKAWHPLVIKHHKCSSLVANAAKNFAPNANDEPRPSVTLFIVPLVTKSNTIIIISASSTSFLEDVYLHRSLRLFGYLDRIPG